ncbi:FecR family protein [Sanguibacteroides justesenii]|uniref:FecR family protein n=1 Tax=Sanguibacteroides justesenii TaxID=1547597 RepID=UPI000697869A|nr:FecR domain-containing protein [Sanguibacteroides justesenii]
MHEIPEDIIELILRSYREKLLVHESRRLEEWEWNHPEWREVVRRLRQYVEAGSMERVYRSVDRDTAWSRVDVRTESLPGWKRRRVMSFRYKCIAAVAVVLLTVGGIFFLRQPSEEVLPVASVSIKPGTRKAILELPGRKLIELSEHTERDIIDKRGNVLGKDSANILVIQPAEEIKSQPGIIRVPAGGEYQVVLSDGTKVWLNASSILKFPLIFQGKERIVELEGEAYFEVARDTLHHFIVRTRNATLRVLGTSFNICDYRKDYFEQTTLVSGSVEINRQGIIYRLLPGEQLEVNPLKGSAVVRKVETRLYTSWREGEFRFQNMSLDEISLKLHRWYNVNFFFANEDSKKYRFTGVIRRDDNLDRFIGLMERTTNLKFNICPGNSVMVSQK